MVLVHGIWVRGLVMRPLAKRLRAKGHPTCIYTYPSTRYPLPIQALHLADFIDTQVGADYHCVAHSLGGLLLRHLVALGRRPPHRAVTLATPHQGSQVAAALHRRGHHRLLGRAYADGLDGQAPAWPLGLPLGGLAGDRPYGIGRLITHFDGPNDGTVAVAETRLAGMTDWRLLHHAHTGMLTAAEVAAEVDHFLKSGCFSPASGR